MTHLHLALHLELDQVFFPHLDLLDGNCQLIGDQPQEASILFQGINL